MKSRTLLFVAVGLLLAADAPKKEVSDKDKLQGTWTVVSAEGSGQPSADEVKTLKFIVTGTQYTVKKGDEVVVKGTVTLDPAKKPKELTLKDDGDDKPTLGIYTFEGDTLKVCTGDPGKERPREFSAKGGNVLLVVLKKAK